MNKLRELRKTRGLKQDVLAVALGVKQSTVSKWEAGEREPSLSDAGRIADYFGVSVDYVLGRDDAQSDKLNRPLVVGPNNREQEQVLTGFKALSKAGKQFVLDMIDSAKRNFPIDTTPLTPEEEEELRLELDKVIEEQDAQKAKRGKRRVHG